MRRKLEVRREDRLATLNALKRDELTPKELGESVTEGQDTWAFVLDDGDVDAASAALKTAEINFWVSTTSR